MIKEKLQLVPMLPGCYLMKNSSGVVIYVGKAKILKNRLKSYFNGRVVGKTKKLVSEIVDFDYIITYYLKTIRVTLILNLKMKSILV